MDNRIFFNPGDSIANINDYNEAVRKGQIFKKEQHTDDLVIAKGPGDEEYAIFYAKDAPAGRPPRLSNLMMSNKSSKKTRAKLAPFLILLG